VKSPTAFIFWQALKKEISPTIVLTKVISLPIGEEIVEFIPWSFVS
jgi:hypothetical protein